MDKGLVFNELLFNRVNTKNILRLIYTISTTIEPRIYSALFNLMQKNFHILTKSMCLNCFLVFFNRTVLAQSL